MLADNSFRYILFRLLNIGLLFGFAFYILKKYGIKTIKEGVEEYHATTARLREALRINKQKIKHVQSRYREREQFFETIYGRLERWSAQQVRWQEQIMHEKQRLAEIIARRVAEKTYHINTMRAQQMITPVIEQQARALLIERYSDPHVAREYLEHSLKTFTKSVS